MQILTETLLENVIQLAQQAGEHLQKFYAQNVEIKIKEDHTPVTEADLFISQFLTQELHKLTPEIPVLSEENCKIPLSERRQWQEYWIIDPLDGTQQFINRTDQFAVVIGLVQQNQPVLGVIHAPILDKTYFAQRGKGAYLIENKQKQKLRSNTGLLSDKLHLHIAVGLSKHDDIFAAVLPPYSADLHSYGSSSLKAGLVAEGKADCYVRIGDTGEWDTAVPEILLAETGGKIFDLHFQPLTYNQRETFINPHFVMTGDGLANWQHIFNFIRK